MKRNKVLLFISISLHICQNLCSESNKSYPELVNALCHLLQYNDDFELVSEYLHARYLLTKELQDYTRQENGFHSSAGQNYYYKLLKALIDDLINKDISSETTELIASSPSKAFFLLYKINNMLVMCQEFDGYDTQEDLLLQKAFFVAVDQLAQSDDFKSGNSFEIIHLRNIHSNAGHQLPSNSAIENFMEILSNHISLQDGSELSNYSDILLNLIKVGLQIENFEVCNCIIRNNCAGNFLHDCIAEAIYVPSILYGITDPCLKKILSEEKLGHYFFKIFTDSCSNRENAMETLIQKIYNEPEKTLQSAKERLRKIEMSESKFELYDLVISMLYQRYQQSNNDRDLRRFLCFFVQVAILLIIG
jgi:hypothetical protein